MIQQNQLGMGLIFDLCREIPQITPMKHFWRRSVERSNIIYYRFDDGKKPIIINNNNKRRRDTNNNQENIFSEISATTVSKLGGDGCTTNDGTG